MTFCFIIHNRLTRAESQRRSVGYTTKITFSFLLTSG
jgi:hypothetical protein